MLELQAVTKAFGHSTILAGISTKFKAGTITAIVGDNGAGKSTLLKAIAGVHPIDSGDIFLTGQRLRGLSVRQRREQGIEMIHQTLALARKQTVLANLFMGREFITKTGFLKRRAMAKQVGEVMNNLELSLPDLNEPAGLLSGGQQQTVAIARAMLFSPKVLLLDEPTAALGAGQVDRVLALICREKERGSTVILVSHRFNDVFAVADRILVLKHGQIASDLAANETSIAETVQMIVS